MTFPASHKLHSRAHEYIKKFTYNKILDCKLRQLLKKCRSLGVDIANFGWFAAFVVAFHYEEGISNCASLPHLHASQKQTKHRQSHRVCMQAPRQQSTIV